jgi:hypothetical protein
VRCARAERFAIVRFHRVAAAAFLLLRRAALCCFAVAMPAASLRMLPVLIQ